MKNCMSWELHMSTVTNTRMIIRTIMMGSIATSMDMENMDIIMCTVRKKRCPALSGGAATANST